MATISRLLASLAFLVLAAAAAAAAQPGPAPGSRAWVESLKPEWSRPVGGATRLVGVEEYGRCSVFVHQGVVQVVAPSGEISWTWPFRSISKYINPSKVAVSHACEAIAFVGDSSYKYVWIVDQAGTSASIKLAVTPADVEFDRTGTLVAVGTYTGSMLLYSNNGEFRWMRATKAKIVENITFADDNERIQFAGWAGSGVVSVAGHVESSMEGQEEPDDETSRRFGDYRWRIAISEDGSRTWYRDEDSIVCVSQDGKVLAAISASPGVRGAKVSRDFGQVLIVTEKDLHPVSVERYVIPVPCKP